MQTNQVLEAIETISKRHLTGNPKIGIDSLMLYLNILPEELVPLLQILERYDEIFIHRGTTHNKRTIRLNDIGAVSLRL